MDEQTRNSELLPLLRERVRHALTNSPAYQQMSADKRKALAYDTVRALHYILGGEDGTSRPQGVTLAGNAAGFAPAQALAGITPAATTIVPRGRLTGPVQPPQIGEAARAGGDALSGLIQDVDFPAFVGGLIDGVFNSIVTTSIKQMEAYAELVKNVAKSVDQYMKDNVSEQNARDYLVQQYPDHLDMDFTGEKPKVKPKDGYDEANMPDFLADLGLKSPVTSLDEDNVEEQLVPAARQRIAMDRQQMLATMVMMGVNRLVVTNGTIEASCLFKLDTRDTRIRDRTSTANREWERSRGSESGADSSHHYEGQWGWNDENKGKYSGDSKWYRKSNYSDHAKFTVQTVDTNKNEEEIKLHAELAGKVKLNFKSDYFPMERMIDALQINQIRERATPAPAPQAAQPALPPPALPAIPQLPGTPAAPAPAAPAR
jgi:hypothetical protein